LCRNLKETPNETNNWKKIKKERGELVDMLFSCRRELLTGVIPMSKLKDHESIAHFSPKTKVKYTEFRKRVMVEKETKQYLEDIVEREKKTMKQVRVLNDQVEQEREQKEREISSRTTKVAGLMDKLRQLRKLTKEENDKNVSTKDAEFECKRRIEKTKLKKLDDSLRKVRLQFDIEKQVHEQTVNFLEEANEDLLQRAEEWNEKFKVETTKLQGELDSLEIQRRALNKEREGLETRYEKELYDRKNRDDANEYERKLYSQAKEKKVRDAATRIKLAYKCYKARELFDAKKKEMGKKKKGRRRKKKRKKK